MAYEVMTPKSDGDSVSARDWNHIVENFAQGVPDLMTTKGDLVAATGADSGARVAVGANGSYPFADSSQSAGMIWSLPGRLSLGSTASVAAIAAGGWYAVDWFNVENFDTAGAFTGYTYTAKHPGYYLVSARVNLYAPSFSSTWTKFHLALWKSGSAYCHLGSMFLQTGATGSRLDISVGGSCVVYLAAGQYLRLAYYSDNAMIVYKNPSIDYWNIVPIL